MTAENKNPSFKKGPFKKRPQDAFFAKRKNRSGGGKPKWSGESARGQKKSLAQILEGLEQKWSGDKDGTNPGFAALGICSWLQKSLNQMGFTNPTPIQKEAIQKALLGTDILATAPTGTGKTGAFGLPLIQRLSENPKSKALVLLPTRELAEQVAEFFNKILLGQGKSFYTLVIGGVPYFEQIRGLAASPQLIISTPGRLIDHLEQGRVALHDFDYLVLDEADRMFDIGFAPQLEIIFSKLPAKKQVLLFSATMPKSVLQLAAKNLKNPFKIQLSGGGADKDIGEVAKTIEQIKIDTTHEEKAQTLFKELEKTFGKVLIFTRTQRGADKINDHLQKLKFASVALHGGKKQNFRNRAIAGFRGSHFDILVATDLASRGLDVENVGFVFNFDLPENREDYIHRVGRTGRNGAPGKAISLVAPNEQRHFDSLMYGKRSFAGRGPSSSGGGRAPRKKFFSGGSSNKKSQGFKGRSFNRN